MQEGKSEDPEKTYGSKYGLETKCTYGAGIVNQTHYAICFPVKNCVSLDMSVAKICQKLGKNQEKEGKIQKKRVQVVKERKNQEEAKTGKVLSLYSS